MVSRASRLREFLETRPGPYAWFLTLGEVLLFSGIAGFLYVYATVSIFHAAPSDRSLSRWTPDLHLDSFAILSIALASLGFLGWRFLRNYWNLVALGARREGSEVEQAPRAAPAVPVQAPAYAQAPPPEGPMGGPPPAP